MLKTDLADRLLARREIAGECWRWTGVHTRTGYGQINVNNQTRSVHRVAYEVWVGPLDLDLVLDHVKDRGCDYRDCFNPAHLEQVTQGENLRRGDTFIARQVAQTCCKWGHEFTPENTYIESNGGRRCRVCSRRRSAAWKARRRARATGSRPDQQATA